MCCALDMPCGARGDLYYIESRSDISILRRKNIEFAIGEHIDKRRSMMSDWQVKPIEQLSDKKKAFFGNAKLLSDSFGIVPLMYGSLGLEYLTGKNLNADDIDILIPKTFVTDRWDEFQAVLEKAGYALIDEHEHTFEKDGIHYSYAQIEELEAFAGIPVPQIQTLENNGVQFKLLSLRQYLNVYTASANDGYRINTKNKKDSEKIALIQELLSLQPNFRNHLT